MNTAQRREAYRPTRRELANASRVAVRSERDGDDLAVGDRAPRRSDGPAPDAPEGYAPAAHGRARGAYVLFGGPTPPEVILLATGSEVEQAMGAARLLTTEGCRVGVVSLPSVDTFEAQDQAYRDTVLPSAAQARSHRGGDRRSLVQVRRGDCKTTFRDRAW
ncbi:MAG: transketolase-like TK C-terminal-containing protein [Gammaproteobacteria bacterium]